MGPLFRAVRCAAYLMTAPELIPRVQKASCSRKGVYSVNLCEETDTIVTVKHVSCCLAGFIHYTHIML